VEAGGRRKVKKKETLKDYQHTVIYLSHWNLKYLYLNSADKSYPNVTKKITKQGCL